MLQTRTLSVVCLTHSELPELHLAPLRSPDPKSQQFLQQSKDCYKLHISQHNALPLLHYAHLIRRERQFPLHLSQWPLNPLRQVLESVVSESRHTLDIFYTLQTLYS